MLGKYANGSSEAMEKADNRKVNFSWIIVSIVWIWMGWQTFINDECLSSLDQHLHSGELLQVILDAWDSRHASVNVIRFTQHWIHNTGKTFLIPSLITLYSWCPGPWWPIIDNWYKSYTLILLIYSYSREVKKEFQFPILCFESPSRTTISLQEV